MKLQLYQDGKLKWTIEAVGPAIGENDFAVIPKRLAKSCSISAESFEEIFFSCLTHGGNKLTNSEAYEQAEQIHIKYFEKRKYSDYDSFKSYRSQRRK